MKHQPYHTKRFWKLVEKEFKTARNSREELYNFICHSSPSFKEQWQSHDFREFCRIHAQTVLDNSVITIGNYNDADTLCLLGRGYRLKFLAHMSATISLRSASTQDLLRSTSTGHDSRNAGIDGRESVSKSTLEAVGATDENPPT